MPHTHTTASANNENQPTCNPGRILEIGMGFWASKALLTAVELGVFTQLAKKKMSATDLTKALALHSRGAADFFDALVSLGMLQRVNGIYSNTQETDLFLDKAKPSYVGGILEMSNARLYPSWAHLADALKTGQPQYSERETANQNDLFDALYKDEEKLTLFLKAMTGISLGTAMFLAQKIDWSQYKTFADIGTSEGAVPCVIAAQHPHLHAIGYDLEPVNPIFNRYVAAQKLQNRVTFQAGDFFKGSLPNVDVLIMGHILHDWDLPTKKMLIKKAYDALPKGGLFVVYEALIDDDRSQNSFGLLMSLNMLIETNGGFDFTGADCSAWMKEAGFSRTYVEHLVGPDSMVVGIK